MKDMNYVYMSTSMEALCRHVNKNKSHPQKGWEGGPKRNIGCKTGGQVLILF